MTLAEDVREPVAVGEVVDGRYRVERLLGRGGMGSVYEAQHLVLQTKVAIKFLSDTRTPEAIARFAREAQVTARLTSEHATRVLDIVTPPPASGKPPYLVMELLRGRDLATLLEEDGPMPLERAIGYVLQACDALAEAHAKGIIHRDLKPANMFLARQPNGTDCIKVVDFGLSKLLDGEAGPRLSTTTTVMGSPAYMSPEQLRSAKRVDTRTDVWSMGVALYELLTTFLPFKYESTSDLLIAIASDPHISVRKRRANLPVALDAVLDRCLAKDPEKRYPTIVELARALGPFAAAVDRPLIDAIARPRPDERFMSPEESGAHVSSPTALASTQAAVSTTVNRSAPRVRSVVAGAMGVAVMGTIVFAFVRERTPTIAPAAAAPTVSEVPMPGPSPYNAPAIASESATSTSATSAAGGRASDPPQAVAGSLARPSASAETSTSTSTSKATLAKPTTTPRVPRPVSSAKRPHFDKDPE